MASYEVARAFRRAAETMLGRKISDQELKAIIEGYEKSTGSSFDRAIKGIALGTRQSETTIRSKSASSDDANRVMIDLKNELDKNR